MNRPSFQFYPGDWTGNAKLRRCTHAERGIWLAVLCLMHDSEEEYGVLRWPLEDIAQAVNCKVPDLESLRRKGVLKGVESGRCAPYVYTPRHAGKEGEPVILVPEQDGPLWFSSRMVRDEYVRKHAGAKTRFKKADGGVADSPADGDTIPPPTRRQGEPPSQRQGDGEGDGASASSSSSPSGKPKEVVPSATTVAPAGAPLDASGQSPVEKRFEAIATRLRAAGLRVTSVNEHVATWAGQGVTDAQLDEALAIARARRPKTLSAAYLAPIVDELRRGVALKTPPWYVSAKGIEAKGRELGEEPPADKALFQAFRDRVYKREGITPDMVQKARQEFRL